MIDLMMKMYPRAWRERYEEELRALIEDTGWRPGTAADVAASALWMQVRYRQALVVTILSLAAFVGLELYAVRSGITENMFWLPRGVTSLAVLLAVVACLAIAARPLGVVLLRRVRR